MNEKKNMIKPTNILNGKTNWWNWKIKFGANIKMIWEKKNVEKNPFLIRYLLLHLYIEAIEIILHPNKWLVPEKFYCDKVKSVSQKRCFVTRTSQVLLNWVWFCLLSVFLMSHNQKYVLNHIKQYRWNHVKSSLKTQPTRRGRGR